MKLHEILLKHFKTNKISVSNTATAINVTRDHLYKLLRGERPITRSNLDKLNAELDTDFKEPDTI